MYKTRHLPNTRIDVADALRGIAVAGIILYHFVEHFNIFTEEPILHTLPSDQTVADVLAWLLSGKMYGIFAMLFGLSFFIMNDNQQQKGNLQRTAHTVTLSLHPRHAVGAASAGLEPATSRPPDRSEAPARAILVSNKLPCFPSSQGHIQFS